MNKVISAIGVPVVFSLMLAANPVVGEENRQESDGNDTVPPSILNEPTDAGSSRTDPGVGRDRIPPNDPAPTGLQKEYRLLDDNEDQHAAEDDPNQLESPAAGQPGVDQDEEEDKFYDSEQEGDGQERKWPPDENAEGEPGGTTE